MPQARIHIKKSDDFPKLSKKNHRITSPQDTTYNCIAYAAGDMRRWWWPGYSSFWPPNVPYNDTPKAFFALFATLGYQLCKGAEIEDGIEKIAIYCLKGVVTHAARQLKTGIWVSKLGQIEDIEHELRAIEGGKYGFAKYFMSRARA